MLPSACGPFKVLLMRPNSLIAIPDHPVIPGYYLMFTHYLTIIK
jgi:hypothetical protein